MRRHDPYDLRLRRRLTGIFAGIACFLLFLILARFPAIAEITYGNTIGPSVASLLSQITGIFPFSVAEVLVVGFVVRQLVGFSKGFRQVRLMDRRLGNALSAGALRVGYDIGLVVTLFYVLWGFHYARAPLEERYGWDGSAADRRELTSLAREMVEASNFAYASLHGSDDRGTPTELSAELFELDTRISSMEQALYEGWKIADAVIGEPALPVSGYGRPKTPFSSGLLNYLGVAGFYFPWAAEANVNGNVPALDLPQATAHEMAHQRGFAREDEASFVGFLVASSSPHDYPRYSSYVFAQRHLLVALARVDREGALALADERFPGVQRDIDAANQFWTQFEGPLSDANRAVNDAYLRANRVPGGVANYGRSVELLIAYAGFRGGALLR